MTEQDAEITALISECQECARQGVALEARLADCEKQTRREERDDPQIKIQDQWRV